MADLVITPVDVLATARTKTWTGKSGAAISQGQTVYLDVATHRWRLADADAEQAAVRMALGVALTASHTDQPIVVARAGPLHLGEVLTPGRAYYLSTTPGGICLFEDLDGEDDYVCLLGLAASATELALSIRYPDVLSGGISPPLGFLFLTDSDGAILTDSDGAYLVEAA